MQNSKSILPIQIQGDKAVIDITEDPDFTSRSYFMIPQAYMGSPEFLKFVFDSQTSENQKNFMSQINHKERDLSTAISVDSSPVHKNQGRSNYNLMPEEHKFFIPDINSVLYNKTVYKNDEEINSIFISKLVE